MATSRSFYRESISNQLSTVPFSNIDIDNRKTIAILTYCYARFNFSIQLFQSLKPVHADSTFRVHETFKLRVRSDVSATRVAFEIMSEPVSRRNRRNGRYETLGLNTELTVLIGADRNSFLDESSGEKRGKEKEEEGKKGAELKITFAPFPLGSKDDRRQGRRTSRIPSQVEEDTHRRSE